MCKEMILTAMYFLQAQSRVLSGYYPCTEDIAICLAGISMQVHTVGLVECRPGH